MSIMPPDLHHQLGRHGQEHVLSWWNHLSDPQRQELLDQLIGLDLEQLQHLHSRREETYQLPAHDRIAPIPVLPARAHEAEARRLGEEALGKGEVAVLLVAGGQGSRLGFEHPKGMYPIGPVSNKSLFQINAEKVLALSQRFGKAIPFLIMTSPQNDAETKEFFKQHRFFGLPSEKVSFFTQGTMPALDLKTGKLLMEARHRLFTSPNGHGGTLTALADSGLLARIKERGIQVVFYFQVDNPLVKVADPLFLGQHLREHAEVSAKVIPKKGPEDKLGNFVLIDGRCSIIEYSDLPRELAHQQDEPGQLRFRFGSPAIHIFSVEFLEKVTRSDQRIPYHVARKKVAHLDEGGNLVEPKQENALKFEMFIFDVLPRADRWVVVEASREGEFEPLKNASGPDSPDSVKRAMSNLAGDWLSGAEIHVPRQPDGNVSFPLEISPLYALDAEQLAAKVDRSLSIQGPTYLH